MSGYYTHDTHALGVASQSLDDHQDFMVYALYRLCQHGVTAVLDVRILLRVAMIIVATDTAI